MNRKIGQGYTIVELIILILVIGILVSVSIFAYSSVQKSAAEKAVLNDLKNVAVAMQRGYQQTQAFPTTLPDDVVATKNVAVTVSRAGKTDYYRNMNAVQNGVLFSKICDDLVSEGVGKGVNQAGETKDYITGCGNWNYNSMQFTGWETRKYATPVQSETLTNYANTFTTTDTWNKAGQEGVVKNFYPQMVERHIRQGGTFPITTFWDYWANAGNGGVMPQELPAPSIIPYYCVTASYNGLNGTTWNIREDQKLRKGACS